MITSPRLFYQAATAIIATGLFLMLQPAMATAQKNRILDIQSIETPGGLTFWHIYDPSLPVVTVNFAFEGAGMTSDPKGMEGRAQLAATLLDEGAGERDAQAFQDALRDHAIDLSFQNGRDEFSGRLKTVARHRDLAFSLVTDALTSPRFEDEAVTRMKNANAMRIRSSLSNPEWQAARLGNHVYFDGHPYAGNSGGTLSGLNAVTANALRDFVRRYLARDVLKIAVAGDITADEASKAVDAMFGGLPAQADPEAHAATPAFNGGERAVMAAYPSGSPQTVVQMMWPAINRTDPDYYALRVLNHMLGAGGFASALMAEVREKQGLTYGIYSVMVHMDYADYLMIESATTPDNFDAMRASVAAVIEGFKNGPINEASLRDAQSYLVGSLPLRFSSTQSLSSTALKLQTDNLPLDYLDGWADKINAVTADDVMRAAGRIFGATAPHVTVVAGAVPDGAGFALYENLPGVE